MSNIKNFFESDVFAVVGASSRREKYGNKVLRCYMQNNLSVIPINPVETIIEGLSCLSDVSLLPIEVKSISIITNPSITTKVVEKAIKLGVKNIWMQPGAQSDEAIKMCEENGVNVIANGPCILVQLGFYE